MRWKRNKYIESFCFCRFLNTISCLRRSFWQARSYFCRGGTRRVSYESRTARQILCRSLRAAIRRACVTENTQPAEFISFPRSRWTVVHPSRQREKTIENSLSLSLFSSFDIIGRAGFQESRLPDDITQVLRASSQSFRLGGWSFI